MIQVDDLDQPAGQVSDADTWATSSNAPTTADVADDDQISVVDDVAEVNLDDAFHTVSDDNEAQ